ncbi:MAG: hypothetical protein PHE24_02575 [Patescibacteria group bacterium]|nr:hypothetical protein [Patescibacteria group bacterium]
MESTLATLFLTGLFCLAAGFFVFNRTIGKPVADPDIDGLLYMVLFGVMGFIGYSAHFQHHVVFNFWPQKIMIFLAIYIAPVICLIFLARLAYIIYSDVRRYKRRKKALAEKP